MGKRWRIHPHDRDRVTQLATTGRIPSVVAQLLICRGIYDAPAAHCFLDAKLSGLRDPAELPGVTEAADRIHAAIQAGRRIVIYGDYDADGMTATALLYCCLRMLGANVGYYVPNRLEDGYGLHDDALRSLAAQQTSMIITVDCGIASIEQAETARQLGLELIVTDHHEFGRCLPQAASIVHPRLPGHAYPFGELCGAGVAFKLAWGVCQRASQSKKVGERMRNFLLMAVGLAALGTVADVVPLVDENRILVRHGLSSLKDRPVLGLEALAKLTQLDQKPLLSSEDIAFTIAPRLNAAGRLGQAQLGVELLVTQSPERAAALAEYIHELNNSRDSLERSILLAATKQIKEEFDPENDPALVLAGRGWHAGVIGIVAGRLAEKYHRPVVMIALDKLGVKVASGSARTACGLNLHAALAACTEHLVSHGGHAAAAGLKIDESRVGAFRLDFCEYAAGEIAAADRVAEVRIDAEATFSQLTLQTIRQIEQMAPFGHGNPRPILCSSAVELADSPRRMGAGERHLSLKLRHHGVTLRAVAFGQAEWADALSQVEGPLDVAYRPAINEYRGRLSVDLQVVDWRPAKSTVTTVKV
jgi:single-stranded-DNA-specific exonuclease